MPLYTSPCLAVMSVSGKDKVLQPPWFTSAWSNADQSYGCWGWWSNLHENQWRRFYFLIFLLTTMKLGSQQSPSWWCWCICQNVSLSILWKQSDSAWRLCPDQSVMSGSWCRAVPSRALICSGTGERWWKCRESLSRPVLRFNCTI